MKWLDVIDLCGAITVTLMYVVTMVVVTRRVIYLRYGDRHVTARRVMTCAHTSVICMWDFIRGSRW